MQNYNNILRTVNVSSASGVDEPVSLDRIKSYLRQEGFIDDNDSTSVDDYQDDDDLLQTLGIRARRALERMLGVSIIPHSYMALGATNLAGYLQLEYGPNLTITSITDSAGNEVDEDNITLIGDHLKCPRYCDMTIEYESDGLDRDDSAIAEIEILRMIAYLYENRGDTDFSDYQYSGDVMGLSLRPTIY